MISAPIQKFRFFSSKYGAIWPISAFFSCGQQLYRRVRPSVRRPVRQTMSKTWISRAIFVRLTEVFFEFYGLPLSFERKKFKIFLGCPQGGKNGVKTPLFWGVKCQKMNNSRNLCPIDLNEVLFEFYGLGLSFTRKKIQIFWGVALRQGEKG